MIAEWLPIGDKLKVHHKLNHLNALRAMFRVISTKENRKEKKKQQQKNNHVLYIRKERRYRVGSDITCKLCKCICLKDNAVLDQTIYGNGDGHRISVTNTRLHLYD